MDMPKTLKELHHAYIASCGVEQLMDALEKRGVPRIGCPDVYIYECQQFTVDEARALNERATTNPLVLSRRVFIIAAAVIMAEAQNALLKTIEEPRGDAIFFFLVPSPERLLPTFRSRVHILQASDVRLTKSNISADKFLKAKPAERISMLEIFTKKKDDEERNLKSIIGFLDDVERALDARNPSGLRAVYRAKRYIADKGALVKPLLEQIALLA